MHMSVLAPPAVATIAVHGSTGYAGRELLRLLASHPRMRAVACTADTRAPAQCDLALLALPHGASGELGRELAGARVPVVDLSADLRGEWQYGLPELHRAADRRGGGRWPIRAATPRPRSWRWRRWSRRPGRAATWWWTASRASPVRASRPPSATSFCTVGRGHRALRAGRPPPPGRDRARAVRARCRAGLGHLHAAPGAVLARAAGDRLRAAGGGAGQAEVDGCAHDATRTSRSCTLVEQRAHAGAAGRQRLPHPGLGRPGRGSVIVAAAHRQPGQGRGRPGRSRTRT